MLSTQNRAINIKMSEKLELNSVRRGQTIRVRAGEDTEAYIYDFEVLEPGQRPKCSFMQTAPSGELVGPFVTYIEGTGIWTNRRQNPVQSQREAITISWGAMYIGSFVMIHPVDNPPGNRLQLLPEVSAIDVL